NNRQWSGPPISGASAAAYTEALATASLAPGDVFAHATYLINLGTDKPDLREKSLACLEDEMRRCEQLAIPGIVMHPGAHGGAGREEGIARIAANVRAVIDRIPDGQCRLLYEGMTGGGTQIGGSFEDLKDLLDATDRPERTGVCLDTCHTFAAGYDIRTAEGFAEVLAEFDRVVGLDWIKAIHLNDSKHCLGTRKDRHEHIGEGEIGLEAFRWLLCESPVRHLPMALETHKDKDMTEDRVNLRVLRGLVA
ncbi:MAG: deoxyribonuclease IV, partial [Sumerlaeia bacterium]